MPSLQHQTLRNLERSANAALARVIELEPAEAGKGAMFRLYHLIDPKAGMPGLSELWAGWLGGRLNGEKREKYSLLSTEKALRLARNFATYEHITSYQSARPHVHEYPGAVLLLARILDIDQHNDTFVIATVSGLSAANDQRVALLTIEMMDWNLGVWLKNVVEAMQDDGYARLCRPDKVAMLTR